MNDIKKRADPSKGNGSNQNVQLVGENKNKVTTIKQPTKAEECIEAFLKCGSLNTFEANQEYNDTCLHSCISFLNSRYGLKFSRRFEDVGAKRPVKRYTPLNIPKMKRVLNNLRVARGIGGKS